MRADLELLARLLVDVRRAQHRELLDLGRQRDRAAHARAGPLGGVDDLARRLVEDAMVVRPQPDADVLVIDCHVAFFLPPSASAVAARGAAASFSIFSPTPAPTVRPPSRKAPRRAPPVAVRASRP